VVCGVVWCGVVWCGVVWCGCLLKLTQFSFKLSHSCSIPDAFDV
jgi:hypothetical protein